MSTVTAAPAVLKLAERINRIEVSATMAVVAEADKLRQTGVDVVDMSVGEPHFSTPQHIKDAAIAAINGNFTRYTAVGGTVELKDAILQRHGKDFGSRYKREETMASVGASMCCSMRSRRWSITETRSSCRCRTGFRSRTLFAMPAATACCCRAMKTRAFASLRTWFPA